MSNNDLYKFNAAEFWAGPSNVGKTFIANLQANSNF